MNRFQLLSSAALIMGALTSNAALAQATGGPASFEHERASMANAVATSHAGEKVGPYARWLMVNGMPEDAALRAAKSIDRAGESASPRYAKAR
jgi:hypothetical protein